MKSLIENFLQNKNYGCDHNCHYRGSCRWSCHFREEENSRNRHIDRKRLIYDSVHSAVRGVDISYGNREQDGYHSVDSIRLAPRCEEYLHRNCKYR